MRIRQRVILQSVFLRLLKLYLQCFFLYTTFDGFSYAEQSMDRILRAIVKSLACECFVDIPSIKQGFILKSESSKKYSSTDGLNLAKSHVSGQVANRRAIL